MISIFHQSHISRVLLLPTFCGVSNIHYRTKERREALPVKPKQPLNPYMRFLQKCRENLNPEQSRLPQTELIRELAKQWFFVDKETKKQLTDEYLEEKKVYLRQVSDFERSLSEEQRLKIQKAKKVIREHRGKLALKKLKREQNKPVKPETAYMDFMKEQIKAKAYGDLSNSEYIRRSTEDWNRLPADQKEIYNERFKRKYNEWQHDMAKWESKLMAEGQNHLVRASTLLETPPTLNLVRGPGRPRKTYQDYQDY